MNQTGELTAADVLNTYPADQLARVLRDYGEERFARRIADAVVRERTRAPLTSTSRLAEIVRESIPAPARRTGGNPSKRTFQALRIEVNGELDALRPGAARRARQRGGRRPDRCACLPLARGPRGEARAGRADGRHDAAGAACLAGARTPPVPAADQGRGAAMLPTSWRRTRGRRRPGSGRPSESGPRHDSASGHRTAGKARQDTGRIRVGSPVPREGRPDRMETTTRQSGPAAVTCGRAQPRRGNGPFRGDPAAPWRGRAGPAAD